jgi:hypothetical protein
MVKKANKNPASGAKPTGDNTVGPILPKTEPNKGGADPSPPIKPQTPKEEGLMQKAGQLLEKGEIKVLNDAKKGVEGGIDSLVKMAGGGATAKVMGEIGKGAVEIFFPTNVIDLIPGGKILSGGKKAAKLGEEVLEKLGKEAAEKAKKEAIEKAIKEEAEKKAKDATKDVAKKADVAGNKGGHDKGGGKKDTAKDPCKHKNDKKKRKYVVYEGMAHDKQGNPTGRYIGRTSGHPGESTKQILARRQQGHHRNIKDIQRVFETDRYAAVRGAEQVEIEKLRKAGDGAGQINGVGPNNKNKDDYEECAKSKGAG